MPISTEYQNNIYIHFSFHSNASSYCKFIGLDPIVQFKPEWNQKPNENLAEPEVQFWKCFTAKRMIKGDRAVTNWRPQNYLVLLLFARGGYVK